MSGGAFDSMAAGYDDEFTNSQIGRLQRDKVWDYLDSNFQFSKNFRVFELNCGTGEDAIRLAQRGCKVVATDISPEMIDVARNKAEKAGVSDHIEFKTLNLDKVKSADFVGEFDLIFSNFGGLNCVSRTTLEILQKVFATSLSPQGRFIAVVMPTACMMESLYFLSRFQIGNAFRRGKKKVEWKNEIGEALMIHYYSPKEFAEPFEESFASDQQVPVGLWVPPSCTEAFFQRHNRTLNVLASLEQHLSPSFLAGIADHYLIDLKLKN
jgi:ubiquinone/menaquinone biosynthesis C-methylase UbiE